MLNFRCVICTHKIQSLHFFNLCFNCHLYFKDRMLLVKRERTHVTPKNIIAMESIWPYYPKVRQLLLNAKIKNHFSALQFFKNTFLEVLLFSPSHLAKMMSPAPSSFWGRVRGRYDIAYWLAAAAAKTFRRPLVKAPNHAHWRLKKRALIGKKSRPLDLNFSPSNDPSFRPADILLIDDILTSGHTCFEVARSLPQYTFRILTIADSFRPRV